MATNAISDMLRQKESPASSQRKRWCKRISCYVEGVKTIGFVYLKILVREQLILCEQGNLGSQHTVKFSKGSWHQIKIRERKGPSRGIIPKCAPHERSPCAPQFGERSQDETLHQERCARRVAWDLAKSVYKLKNAEETTFYSHIELEATPAHTSKSSEEREFLT